MRGCAMQASAVPPSGSMPPRGKKRPRMEDDLGDETVEAGPVEPATKTDAIIQSVLQEEDQTKVQTKSGKSRKGACRSTNAHSARPSASSMAHGWAASWRLAVGAGVAGCSNARRARLAEKGVAVEEVEAAEEDGVVLPSRVKLTREERRKARSRGGHLCQMASMPLLAQCRCWHNADVRLCLQA